MEPNAAFAIGGIILQFIAGMIATRKKSGSGTATPHIGSDGAMLSAPVSTYDTWTQQQREDILSLREEVGQMRQRYEQEIASLRVRNEQLAEEVKQLRIAQANLVTQVELLQNERDSALREKDFLQQRAMEIAEITARSHEIDGLNIQLQERIIALLKQKEGNT